MGEVISADGYKMGNDTPQSDTQLLVDNATMESDTQGVTRTVPPADLPNNQVPELPGTQPRRSQRDRRPKESCNRTIEEIQDREQCLRTRITLKV